MIPLEGMIVRYGRINIRIIITIIVYDSDYYSVIYPTISNYLPGDRSPMDTRRLHVVGIRPLQHCLATHRRPETGPASATLRRRGTCHGRSHGI